MTTKHIPYVFFALCAFSVLYGVEPAFALDAVNLVELKNQYKTCSNDANWDNCYGERIIDGSESKQETKGVFKGHTLWTGNIYEYSQLAGVCREGECDWIPQCQFSLFQQKYTCRNGDSFWGFTFDENQKIQGKGVYVFSSGARYEGEQKEGMNDGYGILTFPSGQVYRGNWKKDMRDGQGFTRFDDGGYYEGGYQDGLKSGTGSLVLSDGSKYEGHFSNDKYNGVGKFQFKNGSVYVGEFRDDKFSGNGTLTFSNGDKYVGEFFDDKFNGRGTYYYSDGSQESGKWVNGDFAGN